MTERQLIKHAASGAPAIAGVPAVTLVTDRPQWPPMPLHAADAAGQPGSQEATIGSSPGRVQVVSEDQVGGQEAFSFLPAMRPIMEVSKKDTY